MARVRILTLILVASALAPMSLSEADQLPILNNSYSGSEPLGREFVRVLENPAAQSVLLAVYQLDVVQGPL